MHFRVASTFLTTLLIFCFLGCGDNKEKVDKVRKSFTSIQGRSVTIGGSQKRGRYDFVSGEFRVSTHVTLRFAVLFFPTKDLAYAPPRGKELEKLVPHGLMSVRYQDVALVDDVYYKMKRFPAQHQEISNAGYLLQHALDQAVPSKKSDGV